MVASRYKRQVIVRELIENKAKPTVKNMKAALEDDVPSDFITEGVLNLCKNIYNNPLDFMLPKPHTKHVTPFSKVVGPSYDSNHKMSGCYLLYDPSKTGSYVGQSIRLGRRVRSHAAGNEKSSMILLSSFSDDARVKIYTVKDLPSNIDLSVFLTTLEQYLFFVIRPTHNNFLIASSGFYNKESDKFCHTKAVGKPLYVYCLTQGKHYLLHVFDSTAAITSLINIGPG